MIAEYRGGTSFSLSSNFKSYQGLQPVSGINKKPPLCWTVPCATEEIVIPVFPRSAENRKVRTQRHERDEPILARFAHQEREVQVEQQIRGQ